MKAITDFAATRLHIEYAISVFKSGFMDRVIQKEENRIAWVEEQVKRAWFKKNYDYWDAFSLGNAGDSFDRYRMTFCNSFAPENYVWFEARLSDAKKLLQRFDCAVDVCEATTIYLSDDDLTLLSVSLQSALEN